MELLKALVRILRALLANRSALALENLALRHQLMVLERSLNRSVHFTGAQLKGTEGNDASASARHCEENS